MAAYPGRDWKMKEIVRYVDPVAEGKHRQRLRIGVIRVLHALSDTGAVLIRPPRASRGGTALYRWRSDTSEH